MVSLCRDIILRSSRPVVPTLCRYSRQSLQDSVVLELHSCVDTLKTDFLAIDSGYSKTPRGLYSDDIDMEPLISLFEAVLPHLHKVALDSLESGLPYRGK